MAQNPLVWTAGIRSRTRAAVRWVPPSTHAHLSDPSVPRISPSGDMQSALLSDDDGHSAGPLSTPRTSAGPVRDPTLRSGSGSTSLCLEDSFASDANGKCNTPLDTLGAWCCGCVRTLPHLGFRSQVTLSCGFCIRRRWVVLVPKTFKTWLHNPFGHCLNRKLASRCTGRGKTKAPEST